VDALAGQANADGEHDEGEKEEDSAAAVRAEAALATPTADRRLAELNSSKPAQSVGSEGESDERDGNLGKTGAVVCAAASVSPRSCRYSPTAR